MENIIPRAFVLTVKPSWNRWIDTELHLKSIGISADPFIGLDQKLFQVVPVMTFDVNVKGEKAGIKHVCSQMTHYLMWKVLSYLDGDSFLVLEDDAIFVEDWKQKYLDAISVLPEDWDVLFIGSCCTIGRDTKHIGKNLFEVKYPMCAHAIMYRKKALPILLECHQKVWAPLDIAMFFESLPRLKVYTILPRIVTQRDTVIPP